MKDQTWRKFKPGEETNKEDRHPLYNSECGVSFPGAVCPGFRVPPSCRFRLVSGFVVLSPFPSFLHFPVGVSWFPDLNRLPVMALQVLHKFEVCSPGFNFQDFQIGSSRFWVFPVSSLRLCGLKLLNLDYKYIERSANHVLGVAVKPWTF